MLVVWPLPWMSRSRWRPSSRRCCRTWMSGSGGWRLGAEARVAGPRRDHGGGAGGGGEPVDGDGRGGRAGGRRRAAGPRPAAGRRPQAAGRAPTRGCGRRCWRWWTRSSRGDPESPLRWTTKSTRHLAAELTAAGAPASAPDGGDAAEGGAASACRATPRPLEGARHPDRDAQFRYINDQARDAPGRRPAGDQRGRQEEGERRQLQERRRGNGGRGQPRAGERPRLHRQGAGQGHPLRGLRRRRQRRVGVSVGTDHDTAAFAVPDDPPLVAQGRRSPPTRTRPGC